MLTNQILNIFQYWRNNPTCKTIDITCTSYSVVSYQILLSLPICQIMSLFSCLTLRFRNWSIDSSKLMANTVFRRNKKQFCEYKCHIKQWSFPTLNNVRKNILRKYVSACFSFRVTMFSYCHHFYSFDSAVFNLCGRVLFVRFACK